MQGVKECAIYTAPGIGVEVLAMYVDKKLDVIVRHRVNGHISKSTVRYDEYNDRYFCAGRQRVYLSDLSRAVSCAG